MPNHLPENRTSSIETSSTSSVIRTRSLTGGIILPKRLAVEIEPLPPLRATRYRISTEDFSVKRPLVVITEMKIGYTLRLPLDIVKPCNIVDVTRRRKGKRTTRNTRSEEESLLPSVIVTSTPVRAKKSKSRSRKKAVKATKSTYQEIHHEAHMCGACEKTFPLSGLLDTHEKLCIQMISRYGDVRDDTNKDNKTSYMHLFGMKSTNETPMETTSTDTSGNSASIEEIVGVPSRRGRTQRQQVANYFRNNPLPITSSRGRQFLKATSAGLITNPGELAINADKACCQTSKTKLRASRHQFLKKSSKKVSAKPYEYAHQYSFGKMDRIRRNTELVLGISTKSFESLNKCKEFYLSITALTKEEIARATVRRRTLPYTYKFVPKKFCVLLHDLHGTEYGTKLLQTLMNKKIKN